MTRTLGRMLAFLFVALAASAAAGDPVQIPRNVPYRDIEMIPANVVSECTTLGTAFGTSLEKHAAKLGIATVVVDEILPSTEGRVFRVQITELASGGNAFIGHRKSMTARGELFVNGESKGTVELTRKSSGGFGAGFKGSCSVLARCSNTLGSDFANWLAERD